MIMQHLSFTSCSFLKLFIGFMVFHSVSSDCLFPDSDLDGGFVKYQSSEDVNKTHAENLYVLQFVCLPGYYRVGPKFIQCLDEKWTDEVPICAILECSDPPSVKNAEYVIKSGVNDVPTLGSSAVYACKFGYELNDTEAHTLRCIFDKNLKTADWKGNIPDCKRKRSCPDPGVSKDGNRRGRSFFSDSYLFYSCNEGYELIGTNLLRCLSTGTWSSSRPLCRPLETHCDLPPAINHGLVRGFKEGDYFLPYEEAEVLCEPGYKCKGPDFVMCDEDGTWESEFGDCVEISCDLPPLLANGTIPELETTNLTSFPHNFEITYVCDKGYRLIGGDSWRTCKKNGWSGKTPHCEVTECPDPGIPEYGKKEGDSYTVGSKVVFSCFDGYELLGSVERYCMPNGQWNGELSRCDTPSNYCPNPGTPIKGSKNSSNYDLGSKIGFSCQSLGGSKYILLGSEVRECLPNHTWSGTETKCLGQYDFDDGRLVRDLLAAKLAETAEEQRIELKKFQEAQHSAFLNGSVPVGRMLDLNFPGRIILYFAFDVSGSISLQNFRRSIEFAKAIVKKVGISEHGARAGALTFSSKAEEMFLPLNFKTTQEVLEALDRIEHTGGGTAASSAFSLIRREYIPLVDEHLGKMNIKSVVFLLTDGKANMGGSPTEEAELLKKAGVEIYCIGITGDVRKNHLYELASKSKTTEGEEYPNVYILQDYATLDWLVQQLTNGTIDYSKCGLGLENVGNKVSRGRILGGNYSEDPWPWMAALYMQPSFKKEYEIMCGGSIIHQHFILTAAHCLYRKVKQGQEKVLERRDRKHVIVKLGLTDVKNETYVEEPEILAIHIHPGYVPGPFYDYDIALLQIERPIEYRPLIRPICLPPKELPQDSALYKPKELAWATGWGHEGKLGVHETNAKMSENLKVVELPIQSKERCLESLKPNSMHFFSDRMFCAGDGEGKRDTCIGDSGGPLMQRQLSPVGGYLYWTQVGIVSWGQGCGQRNKYGYYTHLKSLVPWIEETIEKALSKTK